MKAFNFKLIAGVFFWASYSILGQEDIAKPAVGRIQAAHNTQPDISIAYSKMMDSWQKGAETNGLVCAVAIAQASNSNEFNPLFSVNVINLKTNWVKGYLNVPLEGVSKMELIDSAGKNIKKTVFGRGYNVWDENQIQDWLKKPVRGIDFHIIPLGSAQIGQDVDLLKIFQIEQPGQYTLHIQICLEKINLDAAGKVYHSKVWLPEVAAKIQIKPEDISKARLDKTTQNINGPLRNAPFKIWKRQV